MQPVSQSVSQAVRVGGCFARTARERGSWGVLTPLRAVIHESYFFTAAALACTSLFFFLLGSPFFLNRIHFSIYSKQGCPEAKHEADIGKCPRCQHDVSGSSPLNLSKVTLFVVYERQKNK